MDYDSVKFEVFIPEEHVDQLRDAVNSAGACKIGDYDNCISYSPVKGYWRPLAGAEPYRGKIGVLSHGEEIKVEFICDRSIINDVIKAIREVHPYEEPVFYVIPLLN